MGKYVVGWVRLSSASVDNVTQQLMNLLRCWVTFLLLRKKI